MPHAFARAILVSIIALGALAFAAVAAAASSGHEALIPGTATSGTSSPCASLGVCPSMHAQ